ncbi:MAG: 5-oxoprolinase subunit PxpB, partial [Planctomycetota bacterium]
MAADADFSIQPLGDAALQVVSLDKGEAASDRVDAWAAACEEDRPPGLTDVVPAFGRLGVCFDPSEVADAAAGSPFRSIADWVADRCRHASKLTTREEPRLIDLPVCYGGDDGPDLADIAANAGMPADEFIRRHSEATYHAGTVGFAPGFAYLEGLPTELQAPRRATPLPRVPAGSVAIGGRYTGVYPQASPGGWNVIGRTATTLFDPRAGRPSLILPGDRVRFHPVNEHAPPIETPAAIANDESKTAATNVPVLRVTSPGVQTTLQDLGRVGWQAVGVSPAGAMDRRSLQVANLLAGARPDATAIEATLVGPVLEALASVTIGVAGALPRRCPAPRRLMLREGDRLDLRELAGGARCYVGIAGGFAGDDVLGSAST